jgi:hypothetical protein
MSGMARKRTIRAAGALLVGALWTVTSVAPAPAAQSTGDPGSGVKVIDNPSGGHIYLGVMQGQLTPAEAMGRVLQRVTALCRDRPQLGKLVKSKKGEILAGFFSVTGTNLDGKPMEGLAIVYAPNTGAAGGAVLLDDAARFPTTVNPMFTRLKQELGAAPSNGAPAPSAGGAEVPSGGAEADAPIKAQPLEAHPFPDGTASIRLPAGWQVHRAQEADVIASGPNGETLRFGWTIRVMNNSRSAAMGNAVMIPDETDATDAFESLITQIYQKARKPAPAIDITTVREVPVQGVRSYVLLGDIDVHDGRGEQSFRVRMMWAKPQRQMPDTYQYKLFLVYGPKPVMAQEADTIVAIFSSYRLNARQLNIVAIAQTQQDRAVTSQAIAHGTQVLDDSWRLTTGMSNILRDQTVVVDTETGGHATTSNGLAGALIDSNPNRYQPVSPSGYISGIDY